MSAEWTAGEAGACPLGEVPRRETAWRHILRKWFAPAEPPAAPVTREVSHPMLRLSFKDGTLWALCESGATREYMPLSGVEITAKRSFRAKQDGRCEYRFELNLAVDAAWERFFTQVDCPISVKFSGREIVLNCRPEKLESSYAALKTGIERANAEYARERENLIARIIAMEEGMSAVREEETRRALDLRQGFERLEL